MLGKDQQRFLHANALHFWRETWLYLKWGLGELLKWYLVWSWKDIAIPMALLSERWITEKPLGDVWGRLLGLSQSCMSVKWAYYLLILQRYSIQRDQWAEQEATDSLWATQSRLYEPPSPPAAKGIGGICIAKVVVVVAPALCLAEKTVLSI